jgi:hypothetical protein
MTYRISYDDGLAATTGAGGHEGATRTEYFRTEYEALQRARQLLEDGDHHACLVVRQFRQRPRGDSPAVKAGGGGRGLDNRISIKAGNWSWRGGGLGPPLLLLVVWRSRRFSCYRAMNES